MSTQDPTAQLPELMLPGEVAALFRVDPKTVTRWASAGKIPALKTLGGHRRFRREDVLRAYDQSFSTYSPVDLEQNARDVDEKFPGMREAFAKATGGAS